MSHKHHFSNSHWASLKNLLILILGLFLYPSFEVVVAVVSVVALSRGDLFRYLGHVNFFFSIYIFA